MTLLALSGPEVAILVAACVVIAVCVGVLSLGSDVKALSRRLDDFEREVARLTRRGPLR